MNEDQVFIRADLNAASGSTAFYRLDAKMREFLNLCLEKHGDIEAVVLTKEDDKYHWNIGFALPGIEGSEPAKEVETKLEPGSLVLLEDIKNVLKEASDGEFGDFTNNKYAAPKMELANRFDLLRQNVLDGKYD